MLKLKTVADYKLPQRQLIPQNSLNNFFSAAMVKIPLKFLDPDRDPERRRN